MDTGTTPTATAAGHEIMVSIERCIAEALTRPVNVSPSTSGVVAGFRSILNTRATNLMGVDRPRAIVMANMARSEVCEDPVLAGYVLPIISNRSAWMTRIEAVDWLRHRWERTADAVNLPTAGQA